MTDTSTQAVERMAQRHTLNDDEAATLRAIADERDRLATAHVQLQRSLDAALVALEREKDDHRKFRNKMGGTIRAANARADRVRDAALVEAADIILADNYDDPDSAADAILALRDKPAIAGGGDE